MKLKLLLIICFILVTRRAVCQENKSEINSEGLKKNVFYGTLGVDVWEFYGTLLGNYERMIYHLPNSFLNSIWVRVGAGPYVWWTDKGINYVSTLSMLTGRKNSHLEIGSGLLFTYNSNTKRFHPLAQNSHLAGNLGFRFQKPGGQFVFRSGMGWPEFMYVSLGFCF